MDARGFIRLKGMHRDEHSQNEMFDCVTLEQCVSGDHLLREIRRLTDEVLQSLSAKFDVRRVCTQPQPPMAH